MRYSCDPGTVSDGSRLVIYLTLFTECPSSCCPRASCIRYIYIYIYILRVLCTYLFTTYLSWHFILYYCFSVLFCCFSFFLSFLPCLLFRFLCSRLSFVNVPLIFSCPADHVPGWQPRTSSILLGMVEARSVNVKSTRKICNKYCM